MTYQGSGIKETKHNSNPVPLYLIGDQFLTAKNDQEIRQEENDIKGILADVAPTVLEIMGIQKPAEMTGQSLLSQLINRD